MASNPEKKSSKNKLEVSAFTREEANASGSGISMSRATRKTIKPSQFEVKSKKMLEPLKNYFGSKSESHKKKMVDLSEATCCITIEEHEEPKDDVNFSGFDQQFAEEKTILVDKNLDFDQKQDFVRELRVPVEVYATPKSSDDAEERARDDELLDEALGGQMPAKEQFNYEDVDFNFRKAFDSHMTKEDNKNKDFDGFEDIDIGGDSKDEIETALYNVLEEFDTIHVQIDSEDPDSAKDSTKEYNALRIFLFNEQDYKQMN